MARVVAARAIALDDFPERPDESGAHGERAEHAPVAHHEQQHHRQADEEQRADRADRHHGVVAAFRNPG